MSVCPAAHRLRHGLAALAGLLALVVASALHDARGQQAGRPRPVYETDPAAPRPLPGAAGSSRPGRVAGAGIVDHVHQHVVPRWAGDTNFMPVLADVKVVPEHLDETRRRLAAAWPRR